MTPLTALTADVTQQLAHQSAATASAILALTLATLTGLTAGVVLAITRTPRENHATEKHTRHQRDPRGRGPASLNWIPNPHPPRGHLIQWLPDPDPTIPLTPPADPDWHPGDTQ